MGTLYANMGTAATLIDDLWWCLKECDVVPEAGMDDACHWGQDDSELESDLIDLTGVDLEALAALPSPILATSLRRILVENGIECERYASFQNYI